MRHDSRVEIFLETERLVLRQFTENDVDILVELDGDPDVMHFVTGGRPTPREEIETDVLPAFLDYYDSLRRLRLLGRDREVERPIRGLVPLQAARRTLRRTRSSSATGCTERPGARGTRPKARAR